MTTISYVVVTVVSLLVLAVTRGGSVQVIRSDDHALVATMKGVSNALECLTGVMTEGQRLIKQNKDALAFQAKEQKNQQKEIIDAVKKEFAAFLNVDKLTQENADLRKQLEKKAITEGVFTETLLQQRNQLAEKDQQIDALNQKIQDLKKKLAGSNETVVKFTDTITAQKNQLAEKDQQVDTLDKQIQDLNKKLADCNKTVVEYTETVTEQKNKLAEKDQEVEAQKKAGCVDFDHPRDVNEVVQAYVRCKSWEVLRRGLEMLLYSSRAEYGQLRSGSLFWVGNNNCVELISLLLGAGLPVNTQDSSGDTLLSGAAHSGLLKIVQMLLDNGANVNAANNYGTTPLMWAAGIGHLDVVQLLVQRGAITNIRGHEGNTALSYSRRNPQITQYLQQYPH